MYKKLIFIGLVLFITVLGAQEQVRYAGFCFSGNYSDIPDSYRYTNQLMSRENKNGLKLLEQEFFQYFNQNSEFGNFKLVFSDADTKYAMAFTIIRENVDIEHLSDITKLIYNLGFSLYILDFDEMRVLQSYPIKVAYLDIVKGNLKTNSDAATDMIVDTIHSLMQQQVMKNLSTRIPDINLQQSGTLSMKVSEVIFSDQAREVISSFPGGEAAYANLIANQATESLAFDLNVSMLPFSKDYTGQKMSLAFSDATVQNFVIPPASYDLKITVDKFYKALNSEKGNEQLYIYGAYTNVSLFDSDLGDVYWDQEVKHGATKYAIKGQVVDDFANYNEVLLATVSQTLVESLAKDKKLMRDKKGKKGVIRRCQNF